MERESPASRDAEAHVLGSVIIAPNCIDDIELQEEDFYIPAHRAIWRAITAVRAKGSQLDVLSIGDALEAEALRLDGGIGYLTKIAADVPTVTNVAHYVDIVRTKSSKRRIIALASEVLSRAYGESEVDELVGQLREGLAGLETVGPGMGPQRAGDLLDEALQTVEGRAKAPELFACMSGSRAFDHKIGGFKYSQLIVIAGGTGGGKSAAAGGICVYNALRGVPALVVSYEMDRQELLERYISGQSKVAGLKLATGRMTEGEWRAVMGGAGNLGSIPLWIEDRTMKLSHLCGTIRRWHARHVVAAGKRTAIVAVDYAGLIPPDRDEKTREREVAKVSGAMKGLAKALRTPILLLAQVNRDGEKRGGKPILGDLRESAALGFDADMVLFPWRDPDRKDDHGSGPAEWLVAKHRGGPTGSVEVWFDAPTMCFEDRQRHTAMPYAD